MGAGASAISDVQKAIAEAICIYHTYMYTYLCIYAHNIYIYMYTHIICICTCMHVCMYIYIYIYVYVCMSICMIRLLLLLLIIMIIITIMIMAFIYMAIFMIDALMACNDWCQWYLFEINAIIDAFMQFQGFLVPFGRSGMSSLNKFMLRDLQEKCT